MSPPPPGADTAGMALYEDALQAFAAKIRTLPGFTGRRVTVRHDGPAFVQLQDAVRHVVVAPRPGMAESAELLDLEMRYLLTLDVFVGFYVDLQFGTDHRSYRADRRKELRDTFWLPGVLGLGGEGEFGVGYDPYPGVPASAGPNTLESWQRFSFIFKRPEGD